MWCPKCKIEYRKGITVCADCGTELEERDGEYGVDICEISDEATAAEIAEFLEYSGIKGVSREEKEDGAGYIIMVPAKEEKKAEKLFRGYLIAKEEEKEQTEEAAAGKGRGGMPEFETEGGSDTSERIDGSEQDYSQDGSDENTLFSDEVEDTAELLHAQTKDGYVKKSEKYRDLKFSGITFIFFGFVGVLYLVLCKTEVIPIEYNPFVFCVIAFLFAAFLIYGIVSIVKSGKIKRMIPEEEEKIRDIKSWLDANLAEDMIQGWTDSNVSDGENDLLITAHICTMLMREYPKESGAFMEMIADEYYEEHYFDRAE